ncbi:MAG: hypothetical protein C3F15_05225 [Holophagae bacterium]|nr:MAG: hypothetical protein C3F15_05225 [Holophagae bacterium]
METPRGLSRLRTCCANPSSDRYCPQHDQQRSGRSPRREGCGVIGQTISHYRIVAQIGAGGMGEVWQAHDPRLDREVAIKTLPSAAARDAGRIARFEREARATGALNHPNILAIYDVGQHEGVPYIVSELLRGSSLRERLREADLTPRRAVEIAIQIADGLAAAHARGIIHRDLKPENVFITQDGPVKILDFGLAKLHQLEGGSSGPGAPTLTVETEDGAIVGTLGYMSPEQLSGKPADQRSDIFAFGAVLFEMLAGKRAFGGDSRANVVAAILRDDPPAFAALQRPVPAPLEQLVRRCLEKRPEDRYQSVHDLALALRAIENTSDWSDARPRPARVKSWRRVAAVAVVVVALAGAAALAVWGWRWMHGQSHERVGAGRVPAAPSLLAGSAPRHVAVLPFVAVGGDDDDAALAAGLGRVLAEELALLEEQTRGRLWVVPAENTRSLEQMRRNYNVNAAIAGRLKTEGGRVRIELDAVAVPGESIVASTAVDSAIGLPASLQLGLVVKAAELLSVPIEPATRTELAARCTTVDRAFEQRVSGLGLFSKDAEGDDIDRAIAALERATREDPRYVLARVSLAAALLDRFFATGDRAWLERADAQARVAADQDPPTTEALRVLAAVCGADGRTEQAIAALERATRIAPDSARAQLELGTALRNAGRYDEAERTLQRSINLRPDFVDGSLELGILYYVTSRYDAAANQFRLAVEQAPLNVSAYNDLGGLMYFLERRDEAREAFEASLAAYPNAVAYSQLGVLMFDEADYARAADLLERAVELAPDDCELVGNLAGAYHWGGDRARAGPAFHRAIAVCEASLAKAPDDPQLMASLAGYYGMLGENRRRGLELLERATATEIANAQLMSVIGESYEDLGDRDRALLWLGRALDNGVTPAQLEGMPSLDELRKDPRFTELANRGQR